MQKYGIKPVTLYSKVLGKSENNGFQHFLLFPILLSKSLFYHHFLLYAKCFLSLHGQNLSFILTFMLLRATHEHLAENVDQDQDQMAQSMHSDLGPIVLSDKRSFPPQNNFAVAIFGFLLST